MGLTLIPAAGLHPHQEMPRHKVEGGKINLGCCQQPLKTSCLPGPPLPAAGVGSRALAEMSCRIFLQLMGLFLVLGF